MEEPKIVAEKSDGWWGRRPPVGTTIAWGARAIFKQSGPPIDIVWDRQGWMGEERDALCEWINKTALPELRKLTEDLSPSSAGVVWWRDGDKAIEASPNASYGYLYITAYVVPDPQNLSDEAFVHRWFCRQNPKPLGEPGDPNPHWLKHIWEVNGAAKEVGEEQVFSEPKIESWGPEGAKGTIENYPNGARVKFFPNGTLISYPRKLLPASLGA
jgi:hypothetical protein